MLSIGDGKMSHVASFAERVFRNCMFSFKRAMSDDEVMCRYYCSTYDVVTLLSNKVCATLQRCQQALRVSAHLVFAEGGAATPVTISKRTLLMRCLHEVTKVWT